MTAKLSREPGSRVNPDHHRTKRPEFPTFRRHGDVTCFNCGKGCDPDTSIDTTWPDGAGR